MLWSQLNSVLAKKNQMQPEELLLQVPRDATHKVPEEGPFASPMMVTLPPVKETAQIKSEADVLVTTIPLLTEKDQMQPEELHPQFSREATHEKHVATVSQILNLKNNELDQVADFLGLDFRVHREYYRLSEATTQLAKISKLLLAMEKGCLPDLQGKSLDDIEIEDEINSTDDSDGSEPENAAMDDAMSVPRQTGELMGSLKIVNVSALNSGVYRCSVTTQSSEPTLGKQNCYVNLSVYIRECQPPFSIQPT
ncbi:hypothetical protein AOLI_G00207930 [Acnodon oligacanthus]